MHRRPITPFGLALSGSLLAAVAPGSASQAQPITRPASNITRYDARSVIAPALPVPPVPSGDPPRSFLFAARDAVEKGHTGEAQEALERAETRLLDGSTPATVGAIPDRRQAVYAVSAARNVLATGDRPAALAAIDSALAATDAVPPRLAMAAPSTTVVALPQPQPLMRPQIDAQPQPVITRALLAGHWTLHGTRYAWTPPETRLRPVQSAGVVPGTYVWRDGAYVWVPAHYEN
jgi:hypothetical protein